MTAAQMVPLSDLTHFDEAVREDRQAMIDSVLGTMNAEGEPPSSEARAWMQSFVNGDLTLEEMSNAILTNAHRTVHEANARRLAVR